MVPAHGGGEPSEAGAQKEAANCASTTGADTRYNDEETPPDSEALWSLSCGSPTMRRSSVSRQRRLTKEIDVDRKVRKWEMGSVDDDEDITHITMAVQLLIDDRKA